MKKLILLATTACVAFAFTSCKSSESAYKKAYEQAKQQELVTTVEEPVVVSTPVQTAPVAPEAGVRQEKVTLVSGSELKDYSVVCGSFGVKANADGLRDYLLGQGYNAVVAFNAGNGMYRVIMGTYQDRASAETARDSFKAKYPSRQDFQESWLLYRLY